MMMPSIFGENLFDDFMEDAFKSPIFGKREKNLMKTDIRENENGYELDMDLPGFKKDEITVNLRDGYVTISAERGMEQARRTRKPVSTFARNATAVRAREASMSARL